jgi:hypothetical protein
VRADKAPTDHLHTGHLIWNGMEEPLLIRHELFLKRRQRMQIALSGFHGAGSITKPLKIARYCGGKAS